VIDHDIYDTDPEIVKRRREGAFGMPFGYKPNGVTELGWRTRREALAIAAERGSAEEDIVLGELCVRQGQTTAIWFEPAVL
jgi:hypothetical protein